MVSVVAVVNYRRHLLLGHAQSLHAHVHVAAESLRVVHAGNAVCTRIPSWVQY